MSDRLTVEPAPSTGRAGIDTLDEIHEIARTAYRLYSERIDRRRRLRRTYLAELVRYARHYVEPGSRVLEIGVGTGDLLASLAASRAVGVDVSPEMLEVARANHPELELHAMAGEDLGPLEGPFDYVVMSDLTILLHDILGVLRQVRRLCHARTRLVFSFHSRLWQPVLTMLSALGLHHSQARTNWVTFEDLANLLRLAGYDVVHTDRGTLCPGPVPVASWIANRFLVRLPGIRHGALVNWVVARPRLPVEVEDVTVVCPCRNEAGNVPDIVRRVPRLGRRTELLFVEGGSSDGTWEAIQREVQNPGRDDLELRAVRQDGRGNAEARGGLFLILDADLTVAPEALLDFVSVVRDGLGEMVIGSRLVYPMRDEAMRFLNMLGNKFFARVFSALLGQTIKDTLCGTKVLLRSDYERLARGRTYFGDFDPFGDFDLLFGAAKLNLQIVEIPVRYGARTYGETNIRRFRDGWLLLQMSWLALRRLRFFA